MKYDRSMLFATIGGSLFVGFVIVSIGIGAIFPSMHKPSASLICRGEVKVEVDQYSVRPGETFYENHIYCYKSAGGVDEITFPAIGVTGLFASAIVFVITAYRMRKMLVLPKDFGSLATDLKAGSASRGGSRKKGQGSPLERMSELKKMRDENLISEAEYDRKKQEIMDEL
jgi:hypothetical protein